MGLRSRGVGGGLGRGGWRRHHRCLRRRLWRSRRGGRGSFFGWFMVAWLVSGWVGTKVGDVVGGEGCLSVQ